MLLTALSQRCKGKLHPKMEFTGVLSKTLHNSDVICEFKRVRNDFIFPMHTKEQKINNKKSPDATSVGQMLCYHRLIIATL